MRFPFSLDEFITIFIDDDAPHNFKSLHENINDQDIEVSHWEETSPLQYQRDIKFIKLINHPGLAYTRGVKSQVYRRFGDYGLVLTSSSRFEDTPSADCFSVEDIFIVHCDGDGQVSVHLSFEVVFVKDSLKRLALLGIIEKSIKKWLDSLFQQMQRVAQNPPPKKLELGSIRVSTEAKIDSIDVSRRSSTASVKDVIQPQQTIAVDTTESSTTSTKPRTTSDAAPASTVTTPVSKSSCVLQRKKSGKASEPADNEEDRDDTTDTTTRPVSVSIASSLSQDGKDGSKNLEGKEEHLRHIFGDFGILYKGKSICL